MAPGRRQTVPQHKWNRLRDHLPPDVVAAGEATHVGSVDGYKNSRAYNALALEGALAALLERLIADVGSPADDSDVGRLLAAVRIDDSAAEISQGMAPADRGAARRLAATAAGELGALFRRAVVRAETLELGLTLRAEDLEADQRVDDWLTQRTV